MVHCLIEHYVLGLPIMANIVLILMTTLLFIANTAGSVKAALDLAKVLDTMTDVRAELGNIQAQMALLKAKTSEHVVEAKEEAAARLSRMKSGAANHVAAFRDDTVERLNKLIENTVEKVSGFAEGITEKMGSLVENTTEKVTRIAERLPELTEDTAARVFGMLTQHTEKAQQAIQYDELSKSIIQEHRDKLVALSQHLVPISEKRHMLLGHMDFCRRDILRGNLIVSPSRFAEVLKELREVADRKSSDECRIKQYSVF